MENSFAGIESFNVHDAHYDGCHYNSWRIFDSNPINSEPLIIIFIGCLIMNVSCQHVILWSLINDLLDFLKSLMKRCYRVISTQTGTQCAHQTNRFKIYLFSFLMEYQDH